ncbi:MAG TPA: DUF72 domain-containing protein [Cytophagaceae bacterium]|jgi:uncharacterized protein YecE (DUF72 family)|nr:DUF72 domain-containing protein [Cytophagaceae bacterium]
MQFGKTDHPESIDFTLPADHKDTAAALAKYKNENRFNIYVGCAKWNKTDLKNFYPKGTKDELAYYSTQFNSIELNATFYSSPSKEQVITWKEKTPEGFKFFPKIPNTISHFKRLIDVKKPVEEFCDAVVLFEEKLGMTFLQMHDNFKPKDIARVEQFIKEFPKAVPLAIELRNAEWFEDKRTAAQLYTLMEEYGKTNIIVDTAGRRDILHMRLTSPTAFIRYVGANHESDYSRLDEWIERLKSWKKKGLQDVYFFVHQNIEKESPLLATYFIERLNKAFKMELPVPSKLNSTGKLFK